MQFCRRILELWEVEGLHDFSMYKTYYDAFVICVIHGDLARARAFAQLALKVREDCEGKEAAARGTIKELAESPEKHPLADTTVKWRTNVSDGRPLDSEGFEKWLWARSE